MFYILLEGVQSIGIKLKVRAKPPKLLGNIRIYDLPFITIHTQQTSI